MSFFFLGVSERFEKSVAGSRQIYYVPSFLKCQLDVRILYMKELEEAAEIERQLAERAAAEAAERERAVSEAQRGRRSVRQRVR